MVQPSVAILLLDREGREREERRGRRKDGGRGKRRGRRRDERGEEGRWGEMREGVIMPEWKTGYKEEKRQSRMREEGEGVISGSNIS